MNNNKMTQQLENAHYLHIKDMTKLIAFTDDEKNEFANYWNNLVLDQNFKDYTHRERRILRYEWHSGKDHRLEINRDSTYKPSVTYEVNYTKGDNKLSYAEEGFIQNTLFNKLLAFDMGILLPHVDKGVSFSISIHQFRVKASAGKVSPTTSGIHQDGFDWIFMHFIQKHNAKPVMSEIHACQDGENKLFDGDMDAFLETMILNDKEVYHSASAVQQIADEDVAYRDLLLVTFSKLSTPQEA